MTLKEILKPVRYIIIIAAIILNLSCNYFTEPEPFVNKDAHPPKTHYENAKLINYSEDQIVTGTITVGFSLDWDPIYTDSVIVFVDSARIAKIVPSVYYPLQFKFKINTEAWPNGKYNIILYAYKIPSLNDSLGTMSLLTNALYIYKTSLIFDNTTPTAPTNIKVTLQNNNAIISWTPTNFNFFHSYIIRKNGVIIDEIYSQDDSTYIDSTLPDFFNFYYEVGDSITGQKAAYSNAYNLKQGETLSINPAYYIMDNLNDQVIFADSKYLTSVSTQTHEIINQVPIDFNASSALWAKSVSGDTIYCWNNSNRYFYTYGVNQLNIIDKRHIGTNNIANALSTGPDGKLYISQSNLKNYLFVYNNFEKVNTVIAPAVNFESISRFLSISPDGHTLLDVEDNGIKKYSIDNGTITYKLQSAIQDHIDLFWTDWSNSRIFIKRQDKIVELWDTQTLNSISSFDLPASEPNVSNITAIFANINNLYVAYTINFHNSNTTLLAEYDIISQQLKNSWIYPSIVNSILGSKNGSYLFLSTSTNQWILDIGANQ